MPVMDGFALCRQWHREESLRKIPFIFYTATYTDARDEQLAMDLGACRFVIKPQEPQVLFEIIRSVLAGGAKHLDSIVATSSHTDEIITLREYNEALVRKLEKKVTELEATREALEEDIRQRNQVEASLRESEARWRLIYNTEPECVKLLAADGTLLEMNPAGLRMLEADSFEQVENQSIYSLVVAEHRDAFRELNAKVFGGESGTLEFQIVGFKGNRLWLETHASPLRDATDCVTALLGITRDITERKLAEDALHQSEERYRLLFEQNLTGVFQSTLDGKIVDCNKAFVRMFGYDSLDELLQRPSAELYPHQRNRAEYLQLLKANGKLTGFELQLKRKDGSLIWGYENVALVPIGPDGEEFIQGTIVDVTELKRTEQALRLSEASLATAQDRAKLGSWEFDLQLKTGRWSKNMFHLFDCDPTTGTPTISEFLNIVHPDDCSHFLQAHQRLNESGEPADIDFRTNPARGPIRHFNFRAQPVRDLQGRLIQLAGTMQDVSERKQLEDQLRQSQKMDAIGQLAGGVAHDFNNMLTVINGYSEIVLNSLPENDPQKNRLTEVVKAGARAASLTGQLLAFSRKQKLAPRVVNLNEIIAHTEKMLCRLIGEDIQLATTFDAALNCVSVDPNQIEQVIINVAVNARDAMPQGGTLTIATANLELSVDECRKYPGSAPGSFVLLTISDSGCGMTTELKARIFEPFFTTKEVGKGTGRGLATVYGIIKQSEGYIYADSTVGVGTTLRILLPATTEVPAIAVSDSTKHGTRLGNETILLVEDEEGVRKLARLVLDLHGYKVLAAANGPEAITREQDYAAPIHLLITDLVMPKMSGQRLADTIRIRRPDIKILFISGYTDDVIIRRGTDGSPRAFLEKPFTLQALALKVRKILDE